MRFRTDVRERYGRSSSNTRRWVTESDFAGLIVVGFQ